jgi:hypothetical protein
MARRRPLPPPPPGRHHNAYAEGQGLPGALAVAVIVVAAVVGALLDVMTGTGLRTSYGLGFVAGCVLAACLVRMADKLWVVFAPSLIFTTFAVLGAVQTSRNLGRQTISLETVSETFLRLIDAGKAPYLLAGFSLALAVVLVRMALVRK